jgi:hypothetical protein
LPRSFYEGGKKRRHFTLSDQAHNHLCRLAQEAGISKSETVERLVRCQALLEGRFTLSDEAWPEVTDFSLSSNETL